MVFNEWKRNMSVKPDVAYAELERIRKKNKDGALVPAEVVAESRDENAVLHKLFEWDDTKAAEAYRETQAMFIIRNLAVTDDELGPTTRQYVSTASNTYRPIMTVLSDAEMRGNLLEAARSELRAFQAKYRHLEELAKLMEDITEILK